MNNQRNNQMECFIMVLFECFCLLDSISLHHRVKPSQIININMQKKKLDNLDYKITPDTPYFNQLPHSSTSSDYNAHLNHQSFFMKYASSFMQVTKEEKIQRSSQQGGEEDPKSPIWEISEVNQYQTGILSRNHQNKPVLSNNYNNFGQRFKKNKNNKYFLTYNFATITLFVNHLNIFQLSMLKEGFDLLKAIGLKQKSTRNQPQKSKSSFYSDYTTQTSNQDQGLKKQNQLQYALKKNEDIKGSIERIIGWVQFRHLIVKSQTFKLILNSAKPKITSRKEVNFAPSLPLNSFQNDESLSLVQHEQEVSLAYTADQNFQFSQKDFIVQAPQNPLVEDNFNAFFPKKKKKVGISSYSHINTLDPFLDVYKFNQIKENKINERNTSKVSIANPIQLKLDRQRKHLILTTNAFQLPFISQFYLTDGLTSQYNRLPSKKDIILHNQIDNHLPKPSDQIRKQFNAMKNHFSQKNLPQENTQKPKDNFFEDKRKVFISELKSNLSYQPLSLINQPQSETEKMNSKIQRNNKNQKLTRQEKNEDHQVQDYYFYKITQKTEEKWTSKKDIKHLEARNNVKQVIQISDKQKSPMPKKVRFQESKMETLLISNQIDIPLVRKQKQMNPTLCQNKNKPKITVAFHSPQHTISVTPPKIKSNNIENNEIKTKHFYSPPATISELNHLRQPKNVRLIPKAVQLEYNQIRPAEGKVRFPVKDKVISQQNNRCHINFPMAQQKITVNNNILVCKPEVKNKNQTSPFKQIQHQTNYQILHNRPNSRLAPPVFLHPNIPIKNETFSIGLANGRQTSEKKRFILSPQASKNNKPQVKFHQKPAPQFANYRRQDYNQFYFVKNPQANKLEERGHNFNNRFYTSGESTPLRQNQMISPINFQANQTQRTFMSQRPHSSFRAATERFNIFSNCSPMGSQIQHIQRSNNFTTRNNSELIRPKSMNDKIFITVRSER